MRQQTTTNDAIVSFRQRLQSLLPGGLPVQLHGALSSMTRLFRPIRPAPIQAGKDSIGKRRFYTGWLKKWQFLKEQPLLAQDPANIENPADFFNELKNLLLRPSPVGGEPLIYALMTFDLKVWEEFIDEYVKKQTVLAEVVNWILTDLLRSTLCTWGDSWQIGPLISKVNAFRDIPKPDFRRPEHFGEFEESAIEIYENRRSSRYRRQSRYFRYVFQTNGAFRSLFASSNSGRSKYVDSFEKLAGLGAWFLGEINIEGPWDADAQKKAIGNLRDRMRLSFLDVYGVKADMRLCLIDEGLISRFKITPMSEAITAILQFYAVLTRQANVSLESLQNQFIKALQTDDAVKQLPCYLAAHYAKQHGLLLLHQRECVSLEQTVYWLEWVKSSGLRFKLRKFEGYKPPELLWMDSRSWKIHEDILAWNASRRQAYRVPEGKEPPLSCVMHLAHQKALQRTAEIRAILALPLKAELKQVLDEIIPYLYCSKTGASYSGLERYIGKAEVALIKARWAYVKRFKNAERILLRLAVGLLEQTPAAQASVSWEAYAELTKASRWTSDRTLRATFVSALQSEDIFKLLPCLLAIDRTPGAAEYLRWVNKFKPKSKKKRLVEREVWQRKTESDNILLNHPAPVVNPAAPALAESAPASWATASKRKRRPVHPQEPLESPMPASQYVQADTTKSRGSLHEMANQLSKGVHSPEAKGQDTTSSAVIESRRSEKFIAPTEDMIADKTDEVFTEQPRRAEQESKQDALPMTIKQPSVRPRELTSASHASDGRELLRSAFSNPSRASRPSVSLPVMASGGEAKEGSGSPINLARFKRWFVDKQLEGMAPEAIVRALEAVMTQISQPKIQREQAAGEGRVLSRSPKMTARSATAKSSRASSRSARSPGFFEREARRLKATSIGNSNPFSPLSDHDASEVQVEMITGIKKPEAKEAGDWYGHSQGSGGSPITTSPRARGFSPSMLSSTFEPVPQAGSLNKAPSQSGKRFGK